jgi:hypothetical protein
MPLEPFYKWLDWLIAEHRLSLYPVTIWLSPLLIAWILKGGFWRRPVRLQRSAVKPPPLPKNVAATPPPLPQADSPKDDESQSFAM